MDKGTVQVICGLGCGKTTMAIGRGVLAVANGRKVIMIQFLKGNFNSDLAEGLKRLEPDMKVFRFEKSEAFFEHLTEAEKHEELINIRNGFNFARKVLTTGECDVLILDEIFGILDQGIISAEEFKQFLELREPEVDMILTGKVFPESLKTSVDSISRIENVDIDKVS